MAIGVATTGYHDADPSQQAISIFERGGKPPELLAEARPADTSKYRS
jgi:hypothetical protein